MFANTPVVLLKSNIGVNKDYINQHTGVLADDAELASMLITMSERYRDFAPRDWAMRNIAPEVSTRYLEEALARPEVSHVVLPLAVKVNAPEAVYMDQAYAASNPHV